MPVISYICTMLYCLNMFTRTFTRVRRIVINPVNIPRCMLGQLHYLLPIDRVSQA